MISGVETGSRRLSALERTLLPSVGSELAASASVPVAVVPPSAWMFVAWNGDPDLLVNSVSRWPMCPFLNSSRDELECSILNSSRDEFIWHEVDDGLRNDP
ncbi:MAG: hypothetical protein ACXWLR_08450 [Myxococcales bacterium]